MYALFMLPSSDDEKRTTIRSFSSGIPRPSNASTCALSTYASSTSTPASTSDEEASGNASTHIAIVASLDAHHAIVAELEEAKMEIEELKARLNKVYDELDSAVVPVS